jgi:wyosine [tRNA(Phe)-imidazoG37] synthetase (radical SAM superfamily)
LKRSCLMRSPVRRMINAPSAIAFGPVPSRRLGMSLGINNIPPKYCSYSCVYCQVRRTDHLLISPRDFYSPRSVVAAVEMRVQNTREAGGKIDYITFVADGEPTLDRNLGETIDALRPIGFPIAVISNASLLYHADVRQSLGKADWVSLKLDCLIECDWRKINRPHGKLNLDCILHCILEFAAGYKGYLATETMLVAGVNDSPEMIAHLGDYLAQLQPQISYIAVPTRPPAEPWVKPPSEEVINAAFQRIKEIVPSTELLVGAGSHAFVSSGDFIEDLLGITAVHPMDEMAVDHMLKTAGESWSSIDKLLTSKQLCRVSYDGKAFYIRAIHDLSH